MDKLLRCEITIITKKSEEFQVMENIHNQLVGNQDYIDCNIILNDAATRNEELDHGKVILSITKDCESIPDIIIKNFNEEYGQREIIIGYHCTKYDEVFENVIKQVRSLRHFTDIDLTNLCFTTTNYSEIHMKFNTSISSLIIYGKDFE